MLNIIDLAKMTSPVATENGVLHMFLLKIFRTCNFGNMLIKMFMKKQRVLLAKGMKAKTRTAIKNKSNDGEVTFSMLLYIFVTILELELEMIITLTIFNKETQKNVDSTHYLKVPPGDVHVGKNRDPVLLNMVLVILKNLEITDSDFSNKVSEGNKRLIEKGVSPKGKTIITDLIKSKEDMMFKNFWYILTNVLEIDQMKLTFKLTNKAGIQTSHSITMADRK